MELRHTNPGTLTLNLASVFEAKNHYNKQAKFNGSNGHLVAAADLDFRDQDFTVECWALPEATGGEEGIFQITTNSAGLATTSTNVVSLQMLGGSYRSYANDGSRQWATSVVAGEWVHLAVVRKSGTLNLYVNGVADTNSYADSRNYSCTDICVGGYYNTNYLWTGSIQTFVSTSPQKYTANFTPPRHNPRLITPIKLL